jgi:hypothetical protein
VDLLAAFLPRRDVGGAAASPAMPILSGTCQRRLRLLMLLLLLLLLA